MMSSTAAHAIATEPSRVPSRFRSIRIRASTGKAVTLMAVPMNRAKATGLPLPYRGNRYCASAIPMSSGTSTLMLLVTTATPRCPRSSEKSTRTPTRKMKITRPTWLSAFEIFQRGCIEHEMKGAGSNQAEERWSQTNAGSHFSHHLRLAKILLEP